ncbi:MAG: hypothetical protein WBM07_10095 [Chitinivibrionales bacterium]
MNEPAPLFTISPDSFTNVLGVVYFHSKTSDGGDIYFTRFGQPIAQFLQIENWYEKEWFEQHREKLQGTGSVYKIPTKPIDGKSLNLVVKNCRVGENVPLDTHTLMDFINAEFNSPWEEFSLVMEMRESHFGPIHIMVKTQEPLAIYVPPEKLQMWQTGRSKAKMNKIAARHPGVDLDILRQYKLIYQWIEGKNVVEVLEDIGMQNKVLEEVLAPLTKKAIADLDKKGYAIADMKPAHVIIGDNAIPKIGLETKPGKRVIQDIYALINRGDYSVVDYELLLRTAPHEQEVKYSRRHSYLDHQRDRFKEAPLPAHLKAMAVFGVPYIFGHVESTGGCLWVVGKDPNLFDYFLPERWRKTPSKKLSAENEVYYTLTKDNVHVVWKTSKIGERPVVSFPDELAEKAEEFGYNSPFEEFAIAHFLNTVGVPTVYPRAIYMTGSTKLEQSIDTRRFVSHASVLTPDGMLVLREDRNFITIRGYYNGPDRWVAEHDSQLYRPLDLLQALASNLLKKTDYVQTFERVKQNLQTAGYDGSLLSGNDILVMIDPKAELVKDDHGLLEARICNFELLRKR